VSRRAIGVLVGAVIVLMLALKAVDVLCFGLASTWWMVRHASVEPSVSDAARVAMLGGVVGRLLIVAGALVFSAPWTEFALPRFLFSQDGAVFTAVSILMFGTLSIVQAFLLGVAVRLIAPSLPR
jgi:hypothetical protein